MTATNEEILGRTDANDLEAILAITNDDMDAVIHSVKDNADAIFTWDYEKGQRPALNKLYEKARSLPDSTERTAILNRMTELVVAYAPWRLTTNALIDTLAAPSVRNYVPNAMRWPGGFAFVDIDDAIRSKGQ